MPSIRAIVYIRAVDLRPLYIKHRGEYHLIVRIVGPHQSPDALSYFVRTEDLVEIETPHGRDRILITHQSEFTDEPKLAKHGYSFA